VLETTKTSLAAPRLHNTWVLLAITAVLTVVMLTLNLLGSYSNRRFWYFVSHTYLVIWGNITLCRLHCSRLLNVAEHKIVATIRTLCRGRTTEENCNSSIFIAFFTAATLTLNLCLAASPYGILAGLEISELWSRYAFKFLHSSCNLAIMVMVFGVVIRTKSRTSSLDGRCIGICRRYNEESDDDVSRE